MDNLERLLLEARAGRFNKPPTRPLVAANDSTPAYPYPRPWNALQRP